MSNIEPDRDAAERFLAAIDPSAQSFTFQTFDDNKDRKDKDLASVLPGSLQSRWGKLTRSNDDGAGIFVTINETDGFGRETKNVERVRALFIDLDGAPLPTEFHAKPHIVVESSHGKWHVYWLVKNCKLDDFTPLQRRIAKFYNGDPAVQDLPRVLRVPGFLHRKGEPFMTRLVEAHDFEPYDVEQVMAGIPELKAPELPPKDSTHDEGSAEEAKLRSALDAIPTDEKLLDEKLGSHKVFVNIGRALERWDHDRGLALWDEWCRRNPDKYNKDGLDSQWASFHKNRDNGAKQVTIKSIYYFAREFGWTYEEPDQTETDPPKPVPEPRSLDEVHAVFRKWLGEDYDLDVLDATLVAGAAERLDGDPLWLLVVAGPGAAKTETVQALAGIGARVTSTITSEGALLSASPKKSRVKTATGGLLRAIGDRGILVIKDVTSILSADRNVRSTVLAAIREVYDGRWERNVGSDGGQTLTWAGRVVVVGAVTTAWDTHHAVVSQLGDRFVLVRIDSYNGRVESGRQAIRNTGSEKQMREELAGAVSGLIAHASTDGVQVTDDEATLLLKLADIVTMARTAVERDYRGDVTMAHDPEMPTRFAKQLTQVVRGAVAIGMSREEAMQLAVRCARDSIPPLRLEIMLMMQELGRDVEVGAMRKAIGKPWTTVKREMEALHMLRILSCEETEKEWKIEEVDYEPNNKQELEAKTHRAKRKATWRYSLSSEFDHATLRVMSG